MFFRALKRVEGLVADYEAAKKEENEQRTKYKNEKDELEQEIAKLEARLQSSPDADNAENEKMKQIEEQYQLVSDRLQKQRLVMVIFSFQIKLCSQNIPIQCLCSFREKIVDL